MERGRLYRIGEDLEEHGWYVELVDRTAAEVGAFLERWAAFEEAVADTVVDDV